MTPWAEVIEATWPAAQTWTAGPWTIRQGLGGGNRVSAVTALRMVGAADIALAEQHMRDLRQELVFAIRPGDPPIDPVLKGAGFAKRDKTVIYAAPTVDLCDPVPPPVTAFTVWPPIAAQREIWSAGGIGSARLAVMDRVSGPKTAFLGRIDDRPAGTVFVAVHKDIAMLHAMEILVPFRRKGLAQHLVRACARWALTEGAGTFALLTTVANLPANALYRGLGMVEVGHYHYRARPT